MATQLEAAELLLLRAAWMEDNHRDYEKESAMAKKYGFAVSVPHVFRMHTLTINAFHILTHFINCFFGESHAL